MRGVLITFEGVEGSGKSTQAELLCKALHDARVPCLLSREPGGTPIGERVRDILLDNRHTEMFPKTELLLYLASRHQHVREKLLPAIQKGLVAVSDRYSESSLAYQGKGRGLTFQVVSRLNKFATGGLQPDLVLVVDVPPAVGRARMRGVTLDRLEAEKEQFHESVRDGYRLLARRSPKRIRVFDGRQSPEELHENIKEVVFGTLRHKGLVK